MQRLPPYMTHCSTCLVPPTPIIDQVDTNLARNDPEEYFIRSEIVITSLDDSIKIFYTILTTYVTISYYRFQQSIFERNT